MMKKITATQNSMAIEAKATLMPAYEALLKIKEQHLNYDNDAVEEVSSFAGFLRMAINDADNIIDAATKQYDRRDQVLIGRASSWMNDIPTKIESLQKTINSARSVNENKRIELKTQGFTETEIEKILPRQALEDDLNAMSAEISIMESDRKVLLSFVTDAPRFDVALIEKTAFYQNFTKNEKSFRSIQ